VVPGHLESHGGAHHGLIRRIVIRTSGVSLNGGAQDESTCGQCALRYISSSLLIEGVTLEEISHNSGTKFLQNLRQILTNEIKKYHSKGLKSIKITSLNTHNRNSLVIEFVAIVNPKHHQQISSAIRRALLSINLK
jgi:DNA integrity scanning protein DisA with diadenylate cyclase activity